MAHWPDKTHGSTGVSFSRDMFSERASDADACTDVSRMNDTSSADTRRFMIEFLESRN